MMWRRWMACCRNFVNQKIYCLLTAWKVSKYGVFTRQCFSIFVLNIGKYGREKTPYLDTFHAVVDNSNTNLFFSEHDKAYIDHKTSTVFLKDDARELNVLKNFSYININSVRNKLDNLSQLKKFTLRKTFPFGVILLRIFSHSVWIRWDTPYLSVFSPNAGKCWSE